MTIATTKLDIHSIYIDGSKALYSQLLHGAINREVILVNTQHRQIGKTKSLIQFAKYTRFPIVVGSKHSAQMLSDKYKSVSFIYPVHDLAIRGKYPYSQKVLVDESVSLDSEFLKNFDVVTGFTMEGN